MKLKFLAPLLFLFLFKNGYAQHTDEINSNRPGESMSAFAVGKTVIQIESGLNYTNEKHSLLGYKASGFGIDFTTRYGIFKEQLETILDFTYQNDNYTTDLASSHRTGLKSSTIGAKYLVYDPYKYYEEKINIYSWKANHKFNWRQFIPAVAVYAGANLNFSSNKFISKEESLNNVTPKVMLVTQNIFGNNYVFVANVYLDKIGTDYQSLEYIITLTKAINDNCSASVENKGIKGDFYADAIFRGGAAYLVNQNLQIDASFSKNYKGTPSITYGGIGVSWRSDSKYKDVLVRAKKDKKKDKSKKSKDKEKDKKKKRLDEVEVEKP